jgi:hypothetical protein
MRQLMTRHLSGLVFLGVVAAGATGRTEVRFVDSVVAEIDGAVVAASDVALARALGLFGLLPAASPLSAAEIDRYADGRLLLREATRIGVEVTEADRAAEWAKVAGRAGGESALTSWLLAADIDLARARQMVDDDLRRRRFVDVRFRALAFVSEAELSAALGPGPHSEADREAARSRLEEETTQHRLAEWLSEARAAGAVHRLTGQSSQVPDPLPGRPAAGTRR